MGATLNTTWTAARWLLASATACCLLCAAALPADVQSTLRVTTPHPTLGSPLLLTLDMHNAGKVEARYDSQQAAVNGSLSVTGPDGKPAPYVATLYQTMGGTQALAPGQTTTIFKDLNLADQYLLDQPGTYTVQFPARDGIPASAPITVTLAAAPMPDATAVLSALVRHAPPEWRVSRYDSVIYFADHRTRGKGNERTFSVRFQKEGTPAPKNGTDLGQTRLGHAWVVAESPAVAEAWPGYLDFVRAQLAPFAVKAPPAS